MTVHFRPPSGYVGDLIPFERDGRLWLFYLLDERRDPPTGMPWALASTDDFVNYTDHGVVLPSGGADAADYDCYTGCVIDDGDQLHLFYTGHNPSRRTAAGDLQVVCHATSDGDLTQWHKQPGPHLRRTDRLPARGLARPVRVSRHTERTVADDPGGPTHRGTRPPTRRRRPAHLDRPRHLAPDHPAVGPASLHHPGVPRGVPVGRLVVSRLLGIHRRLPNPIPHRPPDPTAPGWRPNATLSTGELDTRRSRLPEAAADSSSDGSPRAKATATMATGNGPANSPSSKQPRKPTEPWVRTTSRTCWPPSPSQKQSNSCRLTAQPPAPVRGATDRYAAWLGPTLPDPCLVTATLDIASGTH